MPDGSLSIASATILAKAARDEGFDVEIGEETGWLRFESTHTRGGIALTVDGADWVVAVSLPAVVAEIAAGAQPWIGPMPAGMAAAFLCSGSRALYQLLGRARQLGRSLPTAPLAQFAAEAATLPRTTEAERLVVQRVGQDIFRQALMEYWGGRCPLTGIDEPRLLRASHMKPWADCASDAERLDVHNGLLLAAHLDAAFDAGLITFSNDGALVISPALSRDNAERLALPELLPLKLSPAHLPYLEWHRREVFEANWRRCSPTRT